MLPGMLQFVAVQYSLDCDLVLECQVDFTYHCSLNMMETDSLAATFPTFPANKQVNK